MTGLTTVKSEWFSPAPPSLYIEEVKDDQQKTEQATATTQ